MFDSKYGSVLTILLIIVIVAIVAIIGYFGYEIIVEESKEKASESVVEQFEQAYPTISVADENTVTTNSTISDPNATTEDSNTIASLNTVDDNGGSGGSSSGGGNTGTTKKKKVMMEGYEVIGTVRIPAIDIKYPILAKVTKKSLETAVALLYTTNGLNQVGNSVIIGHNYRNSLFFSKNDKLEKGDTIYIKDTSGHELKYKITQKFITTSSDASFYKQDTDKKYVTLSTCTDDASTTDKRLILIAEEVK